jgi:hypothetical protein
MRKDVEALVRREASLSYEDNMAQIKQDVIEAQADAIANEVRVYETAAQDAWVGAALEDAAGVDAADADANPFVQAFNKLLAGAKARRRQRPEDLMTDCGPAVHHREPDMVMQELVYLDEQREQERLDAEWDASVAIRGLAATKILYPQPTDADFGRMMIASIPPWLRPDYVGSYFGENDGEGDNESTKSDETDMDAIRYAYSRKRFAESMAGSQWYQAVAGVDSTTAQTDNQAEATAATSPLSSPEGIIAPTTPTQGGHHVHDPTVPSMTQIPPSNPQTPWASPPQSAAPTTPTQGGHVCLDPSLLSMTPSNQSPGANLGGSPAGTLQHGLTDNLQRAFTDNLHHALTRAQHQQRLAGGGQNFASVMTSSPLTNIQTLSSSPTSPTPTRTDRQQNRASSPTLSDIIGSETASDASNDGSDTDFNPSVTTPQPRPGRAVGRRHTGTRRASLRLTK